MRATAACLAGFDPRKMDDLPFVHDGRAVDNAAAGILWVAVAFSGTLALGRTFERERQGETLRALLLGPTARAAVYLGKLTAVLGLLCFLFMLRPSTVALELLRSTSITRPCLPRATPDSTFTMSPFLICSFCCMTFRVPRGRGR